MKPSKLIATLGLAIALTLIVSNLFGQEQNTTNKTNQVAAANVDAKAVFKPNPTFDDTIRSAMRKTRTPFLTRFKVWMAMRDAETRYELELALTEKALEMGVIQPEGCDDVGVYGNPWTDFLDWVIENWDEIFRIIMMIVDIFTDQKPIDVGIYNWPTDDVRFCSLASPQCSSCSGPQCSGGSCSAATSTGPNCTNGTCAGTAGPVMTRSVLVRRSTPVAEFMRSRTVTAWRRPMLLRRFRFR